MGKVEFHMVNYRHAALQHVFSLGRTTFRIMKKMSQPIDLYNNKNMSSIRHKSRHWSREPLRLMH
jgi:hypothetical protein